MHVLTLSLCRCTVCRSRCWWNVCMY